VRCKSEKIQKSKVKSQGCCVTLQLWGESLNFQTTF